MQQDVPFLFVKEHLPSRRSNEHTQENERHGVEVNRKRENWLSSEEERH